MYEGEVTELSPVETENPGGGYGKASGTGGAAGGPRCCSQGGKACHDNHTDMPCSGLPCAAHPALPWCVQVVSHVVIALKTVKGTKQLKLDPTIHDSLQVPVAV